jgi:hypothetical protein
MGRRGWRVSATALALTLVLAGCAVSAGGSDEGMPSAHDISVEFQQLRSDVATREGQVQVTNKTDAPVVVGAVTVSDPRFDGAASRSLAGRASRIAPGGTVDIRITLPAMDCGVDAGEMTAVIELGAEGADADPGVVETSLPDPLDVIAPLHERECRAEKLAEAASVTFSSFTPSAPGDAADLALTIRPTGAGAATIAGVQTTNLLTFGGSDAADTYPVGVEVAAGDAEERVAHLPLVPLRCDPHAVQEDKRGTVFDVEVVVDGEPGEIELFVGEEMRGRILSWVAEWCGFGG